MTREERLQDMLVRVQEISFVKVFVTYKMSDTLSHRVCTYGLVETLMC